MFFVLFSAQGESFSVYRNNLATRRFQRQDSNCFQSLHTWFGKAFIQPGFF
jgi:hypothetical protein